MDCILFVEDEEVLLRRGSSVAEKKGYKVLGAETVERAFEVMRTNPSIDVLLADIHLDQQNPQSDDRSGTELARAAKREHFPITVAGTSTRFDSEVRATEDVPDSRSPFDIYSGKDWITDPEEANRLFDAIYEKLKATRIARLQSAEALKSLTTETSTSGMLTAAAVCEARVTGVNFKLLDNSDLKSLRPDQPSLLAKPLPVWIKTVNADGTQAFICEVYKMPSVSTFGSTEAEALDEMEKLIELIKQNSQNISGMGMPIPNEVCKEFAKYIL